MTISEILMKYKSLILIFAIFSLIIVVIIYFAPKLLDVLTYFWPLLVSTTLFLIAVVVFSRGSQPSLGSLGEKAGEGIIDYVATQPESDQGHKDE
ncbi:hypothetical protein CTI12_AA025650 [Artemisia annua]|uniref:Transmembrane protein n=1 Tax=Artemisia annua TaxID=35608 RepID=A0A2U1QHA7_ARTAN|nr:hypothetical protein CTI12_AA025650 [Artemisia annua]